MATIDWQPTSLQQPAELGRPPAPSMCCAYIFIFNQLSNHIEAGLKNLIRFEEIEIPNRFFQEAAEDILGYSRISINGETPLLMNRKNNSIAFLKIGINL